MTSRLRKPYRGSGLSLSLRCLAWPLSVLAEVTLRCGARGGPTPRSEVPSPRSRVPLSFSLADLENFMSITRAGLKKPLKEGDYDGLVEVMGHLMKVKERQVATDSMFEPLKQTIELLKSYGEEMPEEIYLKLQVGPNGAVLGPLCQVTAG